MRNARWILLAAALAAGCHENNVAQSRNELHAGYQALRQQDYDQAMSKAEQFLRDHPNGETGTPEALYLQGRVYEHRAEQADAGGRDAEARADLKYARGNYEHALTLNPSEKLAALLHAGIANTDYFLEDFSDAMQQWAQSYDGLDDNDSKAWVLYRVGLCQQRLGRFDQADRTFATVRTQFPQLEPAQRAAAHQGARAFYVQVGAYADASNAEKAVSTLRAQGLAASKSPEPGGKQAVRVGPASTYSEAKSLQSRVASSYPGAMIEP